MQMACVFQRVEDKALVHVICAIHFNPGPKCLFADEYTNKSIAEFFEKDYYAPHLFDEKNHLFEALGASLVRRHSKMLQEQKMAVLKRMQAVLHSITL